MLKYKQGERKKKKVLLNNASEKTLLSEFQ